MFVYIIKSDKDGSYYVGSADNVEKRVRQHNKRQSLSTKTKVPWKLVRVEEYTDKVIMLKREKFLKSGDGRRVLNNLCTGRYLARASAIKSSADGR